MSRIIVGGRHRHRPSPGFGATMPIHLIDLNPGDSACVVGYSDDSPYAQRLLRLGLIPGTRFAVKRRAPLGDPIEIAFRGFSLSLRPTEARCLLLEDQPAAAPEWQPS